MPTDLSFRLLPVRLHIHCLPAVPSLILYLTVSVLLLSARIHFLRPMIFSPDSKLLLYDCGTRSHEIYLTVDGAENVRIDRGEKILIGRSENVTRLIRVKRTRILQRSYRKAVRSGILRGRDRRVNSDCRIVCSKFYHSFQNRTVYFLE